MSNFLVITALGRDRPGIVNELSEYIVNHECNIIDSRMSVLGGEFAVMLLVSGNWNSIAKLETQIPALEKKLDMTLVTRPTEDRHKEASVLPYAADVIALDHPGIVNNLANFFSGQNINIEELVTSTYAAAHTGTKMFSVHMEVSIPAETSISELRESFMDFCDNLNLDAVLEPIKS